MHVPAAHTRKHGLTMVDLIAGMVVCILLLAALLPAAGELQEASIRARCAANLKQIGAALLNYANQNLGKYPRTRFDWKKADQVTAYTGVRAKNPFADDGPTFNDLTAPLYLLVRTTDITPEAFVCPATKAKPLHFGANGTLGAAKPTDLSNFPSEESLSYSLDNPYPSNDASMMGWSWDFSCPADWALVADMNPGGKAVLQITPSSTGAELTKANSPNHQGAGQNVLYNDMHVAFQTTPFCGPKDDTTKTADNIFTRGATVGPEKKKLEGDPIMGPPSSFSDAVLLPVAGYRPAAKGK